MSGHGKALAVLLTVFGVLGESVAAEPATRVADINKTPRLHGALEPFAAWEMNGVLYFVANLRQTGLELWRSDGTPEGTTPVVDLVPGEAGSNPAMLGIAGSRLYFSALTADGLMGLWRTDGTPEGTVLLTQSFGRSSDRFARVQWPIGEVGDRLVFAVRFSDYDKELWSSDGTPEGTRRILGPFYDSDLSGPGFRYLNGSLYFRFSNDVSGEELWKTDGTPQGTGLVKDLVPGPGDASPEYPTVMDGALYFWAYAPDSRLGLWKSDGTAQGTVLLTAFQRTYEPAPDRGLVQLGGRLYFQNRTPETGAELWSTDGTPQGTVLVKDIVPGSVDASPRSFFAVGQRLFFLATTPQAGTELWSTDGTPQGTVLVKDIVPGNVDASPPTSFYAVGQRLFFLATTPETGTELWRTDGTPQGTVMMGDLSAGAGSSSPWGFVLLGETLYFLATTPETGTELWRSDGTPQGTFLVKDIVPGSTGSNPPYLRVVGQQLYFLATTPETGTELWRSDGTPQGTVLVKDLEPGRGSSSPENFIAFGGKLLFKAVTFEYGRELWETDGTSEGTMTVLRFPEGTSTARPEFLSPLGDRLYFRAASGGEEGVGLWTLESPIAETHRLTRLARSSFGGGPLVPMGGHLYFNDVIQDVDPSTGSALTRQQLWRTNGTPEGTVRVKEIEAGGASSDLGDLTAVNGTLFFRARTPQTGSELWKTDGTPEGTVLVKDLVPGAQGSGPANLIQVGGTLFFRASTPQTGSELWKSDGTPEGTVLVKELSPGSASSDPRNFTSVNGTLYFSALVSGSSYQLWKSDGTTEGTMPLASTLARPEQLTPGGGTLYFHTTESDGTYLWKSDGTPEGTAKMLPLGGAGPSFAIMRGDLYFQRYSRTTGYELWRTDGTAAGTVRVKDMDSGLVGRIIGNPLVIEPEGRLIFAAADAWAGLEPWMSDGTEEGTVRVQDIAPGTLPSNPSGFTRFGERVYFSAHDGLTGHELWSVPVSGLIDRTPPTLTCPESITLEATSAEAHPVSYPPATARDAYTASPPLTYSHPSGGRFPVGTTKVTVTATDWKDNQATCSFEVRVLDTQPPTLTCPAEISVEGQQDGTEVVLPAATATDTVTAEPALSYHPASGSRFPVGTTSVTATATDAAGNQATCSFNVTVVALPPPEPPPGGCGGCASTPPGAMAPWLTCALAAWLGRRRRSPDVPPRRSRLEVLPGLLLILGGLGPAGCGPETHETCAEDLCLPEAPEPDAGAGETGGTGAPPQTFSLTGPAGPTGTTLTAPAGGTATASFSFPATAGHTYRFTCGKGTLETFSVRVTDEHGQELVSGLVRSSDRRVAVEPRSVRGETLSIEVSTAETGTFIWQFEDLGPDDHGNAVKLATERASSLDAFTGRLEYEGDADIFSVDTQPGFFYRLSCTRPEYPRPGPWSLAVWNTRGERISAVDLPGSDDTRRQVPYEATSTERVFFSVSSQPGAAASTYTCTLEAYGGDDHGNTPFLATAIEPSTGTLQGTLEEPGDRDVFSAHLRPGHYYRSTCTALTLVACEVKVLNRYGATVLSHSSEEPTAYFAVPEDATYYLELSGANASRGPYRYQLEDLGPDDHGNTHASATALTSSSGPFTGRIDAPLDVDVFSFEATPGHVYQFRCAVAANLRSWPLVLKNGTGATVDTAPQSYGGPSIVAVEVTTSQTYFIELSRGGFSARVGGYTCQLEDVGPDDHGDTSAMATPLETSFPMKVNARHDTRLDVDFFSFSAEEGHIYRASCGQMPHCNPRLWDASGAEVVGTTYSSEWIRKLSGGTYYVEVRNLTSAYVGDYEFQLEDLGMDDHDDSVATATRVTPGSSITGTTFPFDVDAFSFEATADTIYRVTCTNLSPDERCDLSLNSPSGKANKLLYFFPTHLTIDATVTETLTVFVSKGDHGYTVTFEEVARDDHGDDAARATPLEPGRAVDGNLETIFDQDFFSIELTAGQTYQRSSISLSVGIRGPDGSALTQVSEGFGVYFTPSQSGLHTVNIQDGSTLHDGFRPYRLLIQAR